MENLVLNFLVFDHKIKEGYLQRELLQESEQLGFKKVEIRREYFKEVEKEAKGIKELAETLGLELFYSVPDDIFKEGSINPYLMTYLEEAKQLGVKHIKWNIGDFKNFKGDLMDLKKLTDVGIQINIENDQTNLSGKIEAIDTFMKAVTSLGIPIGYVYDLGNWRFVGEDEINAATALSQFVTYIHVKDVIEIDKKPKAVGLDKGSIDWRLVLKKLPSNVPVAIEYPTETNEEINEARKLLEGE